MHTPSPSNPSRVAGVGGQPRAARDDANFFLRRAPQRVARAGTFSRAPCVIRRGQTSAVGSNVGGETSTKVSSKVNGEAVDVVKPCGWD
eukprot:6165782-Pleurochrysis_carterae.AAC.5